jgi:hypothetical protein
MSVIGITYFIGFLALPTYFTGTAKNITMFLRDNIVGLIYGNIINGITVISDMN